MFACFPVRMLVALRAFTWAWRPVVCWAIDTTVIATLASELMLPVLTVRFSVSGPLS
jgi:hypothetical protein